MPTKTVVSKLPFAYTYHQRQFCNAPVVFNNVFVATRTRTRTGVSNPGWQAKIRAGADATTSMTASDWFIDDMGEGSASVTRKHSATAPCGATTSDFSVEGERIFSLEHGTFGGGDSTIANNKAKMKAYSRIAETHRSWQGAVFFGEILETARTLISPAKALRQRLSSFALTLKNKKRKVTAKQWGKTIADEWLEFTFGVKPLVSDIKDMASTLARYGDPDYLPRVHLTARGKDQRLVSSSVSNGVDNNYVYSNTFTRQIGQTEYIYRIGMRYAPNGPFSAAAKLAELSGLTPENWVPTVWELIPWSFVVDYFVNIGDIITSQFTSVSEVAWVSQTVRIEGIQHVYNVVDHKKIRETMLTEYGNSTGASLGFCTLSLIHI